MTRTRPVRASRWAPLLATLALVLSGCGPLAADTVGPDVGDRMLPEPGRSFAEPRLTWAQGGTIHYGREAFEDVVEEDITGLLRVPTGFFLTTAPRDDLRYRVDFWDGETVTPVAERAATFEVSADGRYAGWLEHDTTPPSRGGLAAVRVVDLATGLLTISTVEGMGDPDEDDLPTLYANAWPHFAGFDGDDRAYWNRPDGDPGDVRVAAAGGIPEPGLDSSGGFAAEMLWDANRGYEPLGDGAAHLPASWRDRGHVTPDGRIFVDASGRTVEVYRAARPTRPVRLPEDRGTTTFGGWVDRDAHQLVLLADRPASTGAAGGTGWILVCDLDTRRPGGRPSCRDAATVTGAEPVVLDTGFDVLP